MQALFIKRACAAPFHLLKIVAAFDIAHKQQAFERADIGSRSNHIDGNGNARVVAIAEIRQDGFGFFALFDDFAVFTHNIVFGFVSDFFAKFVALPELFPHHFDDVVGVAVVFGKNQGFGHFLTIWEHYGQMVAEGTDNSTDLAWIDNISVELLGGIVFIAILLLPAFAACGAFAVFDQLLGFEFAAIKADFGINQIDFIAYVYAIGNGLLVAVFADDVLIEKAKSAVVRCGG